MKASRSLSSECVVHLHARTHQNESLKLVHYVRPPLLLNFPISNICNQRLQLKIYEILNYSFLPVNRNQSELMQNEIDIV